MHRASGETTELQTKCFHSSFPFFLLALALSLFFVRMFRWRTSDSVPFCSNHIEMHVCSCLCMLIHCSPLGRLFGALAVPPRQTGADYRWKEKKTHSLNTTKQFDDNIAYKVSWCCWCCWLLMSLESFVARCSKLPNTFAGCDNAAHTDFIHNNIVVWLVLLPAAFAMMTW